MKIGIDARPLSIENPAGIGTYLIRLLEEFSRLNSTDEFILYSHQEFKCKINVGDNFKFLVVPGIVGTTWLTFKMPSVLKKDGIDVFWGTQNVLPRKVKGIKYVLTIMDLALFVNPSWGRWYNVLIQRMFVPKSVKAADFYLAISESTKNDLIKVFNLKPDNIKVTLLGGNENDKRNYDVETVNGMYEKYSFRNPFYCYVGTLEPRKNLVTVIKAFEIVNKKYPETYLVLAGGLGWKYQPIVNAIENSPAKQNIIRPGYVTKEEKQMLFQNTVAFMFPSNYEGFGLPVLEAMQNNAIVITDKISSLPEVGGDAAYYVENHTDEKEMADVMMNAYTISEDEKSAKIELGNKKAASFSWNKCAVESLKVLCELEK